ncbi:MAG: glycosyltransferase [Acidobacteriota bacterium]|nr:glycosyltransferase [Acidobacteriota bacterium]
MRIAVVTRYFPTSFHPWAGHSAYQTLKHLVQRHTIQVFYMESRYPRLLTPPSRTHAALDPNYQPGDVPVSYIPYPALPAISRPINGWTAYRKLLPHVRAWQPEILLNYVVYPDGYAALRLGEALHVPVVLTAIGTDLNVIPDPLCGILTRKALTRSDFLITVSGALRQTGLRLGTSPTRSRAILNGCDTTIFHPQDRAAARQALDLPADAELIVYIGRIDLAKGLLELVDAAAALKHRRSRLQCILVGDGADEPAVLARIQHHNAAAWLRIVPPCRSDGVARWMAAADLVTLPSYREGCPNVVLEALAAGRPMVASNVGGIPELMDEQCGSMVPARDAAALETALDQTLARLWDPASISQRHSRSWQDVALDVEQVLQDVLQRRQSVGRP